VLAPLVERRRRAPLKVGFQQPLGVFADLRLGARPLLRGERVPLVGHLGVALDRGERDPEQPSGSDLSRPSTEGFYYLPAQILGIGIHALMVPSCQLHCKPL
jgi:hypothetical protein